MAKMYINETHIRKIVKETLENILIDEDNFITNNFNTDEVINILKNANYKGVDDCSVNENGQGFISFNLETQDGIDLMLYIDFIIKGHRISYNPGNNYDVAPEGGEYEIESIDITFINFYYNGEEYPIKIENEIQQKYFDDILKNQNIIYEKADENIEDEYDTSDDEYDNWRDRQYNN